LKPFQISSAIAGAGQCGGGKEETGMPHQPVYPPVVPYLLVPDGAGEIDFLRRAFDAVERLRVPGENGRVTHAEITVGTGLIMLAEPQGGEYEPASPMKPAPVGLMIQLEGPADVERLYGQALAAGGTSEIPPRDEPWGARLAGIVDPAGHRWWLHAPLREPAD
jgi:uncharacterized glyoxalase superfamily protein PhnB